MNELSSDLARALLQCEREPIHRPGAIQPHGVLLKLGPDPLAGEADAAVLAASANAPGAQGSRLSDHLDRASVARVARLVAELAGGSAPPTDPTGERWAELHDHAGRAWSGSARPEKGGGGAVLLELEAVAPEPAGADADAAFMLDLVNEAAEQLRHARDLGAAAALAADAIRALTGFDRVMTYRFEPDWNGVVLAESLAGPPVGSFAGLRFPATDIPAQARALYRDERIRLIPDALAVPVPMRGAPVDMSRSGLRAVSPVHLAYLVNMGVRASMSVAVLDENGELWGLLACHHERGPKHPGAPERAACALVARALGARTGSLLAGDAEAGRLRVAHIRERLVSDVADPEQPLETTLRPLGTAIADALDAHGVGIVGADGVVFADPPDLALPPDLLETLNRTAPGGVLVRDDLGRSELGPSGRALVGDGHAGLIAHRITEGDDPLWLCWLRPERRRDVAWAGNPDKQTVVDAGGLPVLTPRRSFATWIEQVGGRSTPFGVGDVAAAQAIAEASGRALLRRTAAVERANRELVVRNEQIRFFADAAVHDLREPLWQIQVFAGMLRENLRAAPDGAAAAAPGHDEPGGADDASLADIIERSSARMRDLLDGLARFATAGADPDRLRTVPLLEIIEEARADLAERLQSADTALTIAVDPALVLNCDPAQIRRVIQNLLSNAVKYRSHERTLAVAIEARRSGDRLVLGHGDNGRGFAPTDNERIFEPFRRLDRGDASAAPDRTDDGGDPPADGLGLGLAICRRIVEGHGGTITADGALGIGARFTVSLPLHGPATTAAASRDPNGAAA